MAIALSGIASARAGHRQRGDGVGAESSQAKVTAWLRVVRARQPARSMPAWSSGRHRRMHRDRLRSRGRPASRVASGPGANDTGGLHVALAPASSAASAGATAVVPAPAASRSSTAFAVVVQSVPLPNAEGIAPFVAANRAAR